MIVINTAAGIELANVLRALLEQRATPEDRATADTIANVLEQVTAFEALKNVKFDTDVVN